MSADEFDPFVERLFARAPAMPDAPLFTAQVEQRLQKGSRVRFLALSLAGLVGGAADHPGAGGGVSRNRHPPVLRHEERQRRAGAQDRSGDGC